MTVVEYHEFVVKNGVSAVYADRYALIGEERHSGVLAVAGPGVRYHPNVDAASMGFQKRGGNGSAGERIGCDKDGVFRFLDSVQDNIQGLPSG